MGCLLGPHDSALTIEMVEMIFIFEGAGFYKSSLIVDRKMGNDHDEFMSPISSPRAMKKIA